MTNAFEDNFAFLSFFVVSRLLVISCGDPGTPANGVQFGADFTFNKTVSYQCSPGYVMEPAASPTIRCTMDGTWNHSKPACRGSWPPPAHARPRRPPSCFIPFSGIYAVLARARNSCPSYNSFANRNHFVPLRVRSQCRTCMNWLRER